MAASNTFATNQTVKDNLSASGIVTGGTFKIGADLWGFGSSANGNAYLGFGGNAVSTGAYNTAAGYQALIEDTNGNGNTAYGADAMILSNGGGYNTATGVQSLAQNDGDGNTTYGAGSGAG